jgi:hypothetical protein
MTLDLRTSSASRSPLVARISDLKVAQGSSSPTIDEVRELMVTVEDVRSLAMSLPRTTEALVRDRVKFRVGRIVYIAFSRDETVMGFAFPKEEREALVRSEPDKFMMPGASDLRYHWVEVRLDALDVLEMRELVLDAWRMVVPKSVAAAYDDS